MVEGPTAPGSGGIGVGPLRVDFPGVVPAAINEASEIMAQLNIPFYDVTDFEYAVKGRQVVLTRVKNVKVSALHIFLLMAGPAAAVAVLKILELASGTGKSLGSRGGDTAAEVAQRAKEAADTIVDVAAAGAREAGEGSLGALKRIWSAFEERVKIPGVP